MTSIFNLVSSPPESPTLAASTLPLVTGNSASETGSESTRASLSRSGSPSDTGRTAATPGAGSKRPAEDLDQYAVLTARRVRLKPAGQQELERVAKLPPAQRSIWMGGQLLKLNEQLTAIQPTDAQWDIPKTLRDKIENYTFIVLLSPVLSYYLGRSAGASNPVKLVQSILENHPSWGFTKEVRADKYKCDIVVKRIQVRLTDRRAEIKEALDHAIVGSRRVDHRADSLESIKEEDAVHVKLNIVELCQVVIAKYAASNAVVTIQMCARFAFLRKILLEMTKKPQLEASGGYWALVDTELSAVRERYKDEPIKLSKLLTQSLKADQEVFGHAEVPLANSEDNTISGPSRAQNIADSAACGMFIDDEDDY